MESNNSSKLKLPVSNGYVFLDCEEVLMLIAEGNYTRIITVRNDEYYSSYNMGRLYKKIKATTFYRVNRSCVLNTHYLRRINRRQNIATINVNEESQEIPVSKAFIVDYNKNFR